MRDAAVIQVPHLAPRVAYVTTRKDAIGDRERIVGDFLRASAAYLLGAAGRARRDFDARKPATAGPGRTPLRLSHACNVSAVQSAPDSKTKGRR